MSYIWYEGSDCRWSVVRNGKGNCTFNSLPGNLRVVTGISCFLRPTGLLSLILSILLPCALAETVNVLTLYHHCHGAVSTYLRERNHLWSCFFPCRCCCMLRSRSLCLKFEEPGDGKKMQFKPRDLFLPACRVVERNWNPADIASVLGFPLAHDCLFWRFPPAAQS